jgi:hypothetical protein
MAPQVDAVEVDVVEIRVLEQQGVSNQVNRNVGRDPGWGTGVAAAGIPAGAGG